jgi:hypothetical protein
VADPLALQTDPDPLLSSSISDPGFLDIRSIVLIREQTYSAWFHFGPSLLSPLAQIKDYSAVALLSKLLIPRPT